MTGNAAGGNVSGPRAWLMAARPKTLPAAGAPVAVAAALAFGDGSFHLASVAVALVLALLLQILANVSNDYFDEVHGRDSPNRVGPVRVTAAGLIAPKLMRRAMVVLVVMILGVGSYVALRSGLVFAIVGLLAVASAFAYSSGPFPLSTHGLGDFFAFLFFGPVAVCGTYYLQVGELTPLCLLASIPVGALVAAILVVNNHRDLEADRAAGKITLAVRLGPRGTRIQFALLLLLAYASTAGLGILTDSPWIAVCGLAAPLVVRVIRDMNGRVTGAALNRTLARTALLCLFHSVLMATGLVLTTVAPGGALPG